MSRPDDHTVTASELSAIRERADFLLREACAYGRFPTPVDDIVAAAKLQMEREVSLDVNYLTRMYRAVSGKIKRAVEKVRGLLHFGARMIYLDLSVKQSKQRFVSLHETGHACLPWQRDLYALMEDGDAELDPETDQAFEREANVFASEVLFQLDSFQEDARSCAFTIKTPIDLAKRYGASTYAAIRRFVSKSQYVCAVLVLEPPVYEIGRGYTYRLRRAVCSPGFEARYGLVQWPDVFFTKGHGFASRLPSHFKRKFTQRCRIPSPVPRERERFYLEAFDTTYQTFALVFPESELPTIKAAVRP
ncbi:MAG: ImmA/IrrE family metallo-endopeptidase [Acidobacteria bacterium]|nr:MAG: ImmA/IrrE family metallo-endopeptidase [Acidobacteriota bacterium]